MNRKGQITILLNLAIAVSIFFLAYGFAPVLKQLNDEGRGPTTATTIGLDCTNATISDFDKANCVGQDIFNPLYTAAVLAIGSYLFVAKVVAG